MALTLLAGPANAGKVACLLDRYLADLAREPVLIVPNRADVDRVERDLLERRGALLGGEIGTFDDLFQRIARSNGAHRPLLSDAQRALVVRSVVARARLDRLGPSARFAGFGDTLSVAVSELESGLVKPADVGGELGELVRVYHEELERLGLWDSDVERRHAAERVASDFGAWDSRPIYAYGFEDLTGAQWELLEALAARVDVTVSLPYEPGRAVFASLEQTASDLARLAEERIEELPSAYETYAPAALAQLERALFTGVEELVPTEGAIRFLEGAGSRGAAELVAGEILELLRGGTSAEEIVVICPSIERWRSVFDTAFGTLGVPYSVEGRIRLAQSAFGQALLSALRYAWLGGGRADLYGFMRSPFSGLRRDHVDFLEGRLRGRAVRNPERVEEETLKLRGQGLPFLDSLRAAPGAVEAVRDLARTMITAAHGLGAPPVDDSARLDLRASQAVVGVLDDLDGWRELGQPVGVDDVVASLERAQVRLGSSAEAGRVAVIDLLRARTRRYAVVFVLGLEEGSLPRRVDRPRLLDDDVRRDLETRSGRTRLPRPDSVSRDRYLFYTACTRASRRLYLVREAATEDGSPRQASPFWDAVRTIFEPDDVERWTTRRRLSTLVWPLADAPSERERIRATAALAATDPEAARTLGRAYGWERRIDRALGAFTRSTVLTHPRVLEELAGRATFSVTELEAFAECSSIWLVERLVNPRTIDGEVDAKLRGSVAHQTLYRFFSGLPKRLKTDGVEAEHLDEALVFLRECLDDALAGHVYGRLELTDVQRHELEQRLWRDLEQFVRSEAESELRLVPRRFEVSFGSERSAPELRAGLDLGGFSLSGKIDRIDLDPFSAHGIVQDYKSGVSAHSAQQIDSELKLQIPLYMVVLRDLVGVEPLGGLYRALAGEQKARGLLRAQARTDGLPGFAARDYLDDDEFWGVVERAQEHARRIVGRIRTGDVRHDPKGGGSCPTWCGLSSMCRVSRA